MSNFDPIQIDYEFRRILIGPAVISFETLTQINTTPEEVSALDEAGRAVLIQALALLSLSTSLNQASAEMTEIAASLMPDLKKSREGGDNA